MTEKEIAEVRRTLRKEKNAVPAVYGCYINAEGRIITEFERSFGLAEESETEKYLSIFKKTLSGALGKNLIDIPFSTSQVESGEEYKLLKELKNCALKDEKLRTEFYTKIAGAVNMKDNYVLLLIYNSYDTPFKTSDGERDESRFDVYSCIHCALCPVKAGRSALTYQPNEKTFLSLPPNGSICPPQIGFLFPAFDGRQTNIYASLLYTASDEDIRTDFDRAVFGETPLPMPAAEQKRNFKSVLSSSLEEECSFEVAKKLHCEICDKIEIHKETKDPEPLLLSKTDMKEVLRDCGVKEEKLDSFTAKFNESFGAATDLPPKNIVSPTKFEVRTPNVVIKVAKGFENEIQTREIDGKKYLLIAADEGVELNGLPVTLD